MNKLTDIIERDEDHAAGACNMHDCQEVAFEDRHTLLELLHTTVLGFEKEIDELKLDRGRRDAKIAILTGVLAKLARDGQVEYAQKMLKKSDEAWMRVTPKDLVVAKVSTRSKGHNNE